MTGWAFPQNHPHIGEWWALRRRYGVDVGFYFNGEHDEEFDVSELGPRVAEHLEDENPPYPGWLPPWPNP